MPESDMSLKIVQATALMCAQVCVDLGVLLRQNLGLLFSVIKDLIYYFYFNNTGFMRLICNLFDK